MLCFLFLKLCEAGGRRGELRSLPGDFHHAPAVREKSMVKIENHKERLRDHVSFPDLGKSPNVPHREALLLRKSGSEAIPDFAALIRFLPIRPRA